MHEILRRRKRIKTVLKSPGQGLSNVPRIKTLLSLRKKIEGKIGSTLMYNEH